MTIVIPVSRPPRSLFPDPVEPFARKVSRRLMSGLGFIRQGIDRLSVARVTEGVLEGVSSNLCEAVDGMLPLAEAAFLDVAVRWSGDLDELTPEEPHRVRFSRSDSDYLRQAARLLKEEQHEANVRVEGWVTNIHSSVDVRDESVKNGIVQITRSDSGKGTTVRVLLGERDFMVAAYAISEGRKVAVVGMLTKTSGDPIPWIREYRSFNLIDVPAVDASPGRELGT